jgi:uncharacterized RDD family membrane protein YckC
MQNPPPPPPRMMPPGGGYAMATPGNLASPGQRIVGGLIDFVILFVINGVIGVILQKLLGVGGVIDLILDVAYFAYFWNERGQSIGMMVFGFKVRDLATGQYPSVGAAALRGFVWIIEAFGTFVCLIGAIGWGWQLWDSQRQAIHDKIAGTIVTTG